ncbi:MAG: hypothetical protein ABW165_14470 [Candidatus Thiodiazotropha sp.]
MKYWNSDDAKKDKAQLARVSTSIRKVAKGYLKAMDTQQAATLREAAEVVEKLSDKAEEAYRTLYSKELKEQAQREIEELEFQKVGEELLHDIKATEYASIGNDVKEYVNHRYVHLCIPDLDVNGRVIHWMEEKEYVLALGELLVKDGKSAADFWHWRVSRDTGFDELPEQGQRRARL